MKRAARRPHAVPQNKDSSLGKKIGERKRGKRKRERGEEEELGRGEQNEEKGARRRE